MFVPPFSERSGHLHIDKMRVGNKLIYSRVPTQTWWILPDKDDLRTGTQRQIDAFEIYPRERRADLVDGIDISIQRPDFFQWRRDK